MREFSKHVGDTILVFKVSKNIKFVNSLVHSPELNYIERLWKYIKDNILKNLDYLVENIGKFIKEKFNCSIIKSICKYSIKKVYYV